MHPQAFHRVYIRTRFGLRQRETLYNTREISQVEDIMGFGGRGQQILHGLLVDGQCGVNDFGHDRLERIGKAFDHDVPVEDLGENGAHGLVVEFVDSDQVEMTQETGRDIVSATAGRTHGAHELYLDEIDFGLVFAVVPVPVVEHLTQELDGRLSTIRLYLWHVYVVYKANAFLSHGRAKDTLKI